MQSINHYTVMACCLPGNYLKSSSGSGPFGPTLSSCKYGSLDSQPCDLEQIQIPNLPGGSRTLGVH